MNDKVIKVLSIGQLPVEVGGSYTTGVTNVVYELSKQKPDGILSYVYSTNITEKNAKKICSYSYQYMGYVYRPISMIFQMLSHPLRTIHEWRHYIKLDHRSPLRFEFYKYNFRRAIKMVQPDIIHMHAEGLAPLYYSNLETKIPIIQTYHGCFYRGDPSDIIGRDRHLGCIDFVDYATGLTAETHEEIVRILGFTDESRISIIPNGIDVKKTYFSQSQREIIRKEFNVEDQQVVFVTMASVQERKGQFAFLKVLEKTDLNFQYWIIGKGPQYDEIKAYVTNNHLSTKVKLLGYRNNTELYKYYSAADIYAHPSTMEGQALSEIEAYTTGLRTVVNKQIKGTVIGDINDKYHYYVMDLETPNLRDFSDWVLLPNDARKTCPQFDWSVIANKYGDLYKSIYKRQQK